ncbi:MAG TPA: POTRA domain-containing protein [Flavipsychrobacter sp.]|nr:POTRA domain-containing protein [Flavipsychrobacter sp.]
MMQTIVLESCIILQPFMSFRVLLVFFWVIAHSAAAQSDSVSQSPHSKFSSATIIIENIHITGNRTTKEDIILREMNVKPGDEIPVGSLSDLLVINRKRIYNSALFTNVTVTADTIDTQKINLLVTVNERWYIIPQITFQLADRNFNVWWTEQNADISRSIIGLTTVHKNFRGNRELLGVSTLVGYRKEFSVSYLKPFIDKEQKKGIGFEAGISSNKELFYTTDSNKLLFIRNTDRHIISRFWVAALLTYRPAYTTVHQFKLSFKHSKVDDTVLQLNPDYYRNGSNALDYLELNYRVDVNNVDNWAYPLTGSKIVGNLFTNIGFKGIKFFSYVTLEAGKYNRLADKWYSSFILRGKLSVPGNQPYIARQALGTKYEYVRGYELFVIDGYQYGIVRSNLKYELLNINIRNIPFKYLPALPLRIYPKLFADAGYVATPQTGNSYLNNRLIYSVGAGIDIFTAYDFKVRFEYAINHLGQKGLFLHFNAE